MRAINLQYRNIAKRQFVDYLMEKGAVRQEDRFVLDEVVVTLLSEAYVSLGAIPIVEIEVKIEGEDPIFSVFVEDFRREFLRLGA